MSSNLLAVNAKLHAPISVLFLQMKRVRKILNDGTIVTIAGNGKEGFSGDNGPATDAELNFPISVFVSLNNEVYICDYHNHRIRKILNDGTIITIAGSGKQGYSGNNGPAVDADLNGPISIFVTPNNEVYFCEFSNHRVRKILNDGTIVTIAGNGEKGSSGDNGPAVDSKLNNPRSVFVTPNNEVYICEYGNQRIRKILNDGIIVTVFANGVGGHSIIGPSCVFVTPNDEILVVEYNAHRIKKILNDGSWELISGKGQGYSGDNGPATNAELNLPISTFVSPNNEIYICDYNNHRIRKILNNGTIVTIAGTGEKGYSGDSPFDISLFPHINSRWLNTKLKKHSRDRILGLEIYGFIPLLERVSPEFCKCILTNENLMGKMNSNHLEIIQLLIDSLIYETSVVNQFKDKEVLDVLLILGLFENSEFINLKRFFIGKFTKHLAFSSLEDTWDQIEKLLAFSRDELSIKNYILELLNTYCAEYAATQLKTSDETCKMLSNAPVVLRNYSMILPKMSIPQPTPITIDEKVKKESKDIETLYNDESTSDIKIQMGPNNFLYCHKTILSSSSCLFQSIFESGACFTDLSDGIFTPDESEDLKTLEVIIKFCYRVPFDNNLDNCLDLLDMAMKHEIPSLVDYCKTNMTISIDNYFDIAADCQHYCHLESFKSFYQKLLKFGVDHRKSIFTTREAVSQLPNELWQDLLIEFGKFR